MKPVAGLAVLLVEDEFLIAIDAEQMLRDMGAASVDVANSFEEAWHRLETGRFDVVLLDVNLNGKKSFPLGELAARRGFPVVFATGYSLTSRPPPDFKSGVCVKKPYSAATLAAGLAAALETKIPEEVPPVIVADQPASSSVSQ